MFWVCFFRPVLLVGSSLGPCSLQPGCTTSLTPRRRRPRDCGPGRARLTGGLTPGSRVHSWVWPWEPQRSYLAQAGGALGFLCENQSAFPLVVWLPLRCETLPSSVIVPSSSNVAQSASSRAWSILESPPSHTPHPQLRCPPHIPLPTPSLTTSALRPIPASSTFTEEQLPVASRPGAHTLHKPISASARQPERSVTQPEILSDDPVFARLWEVRKVTLDHCWAVTTRTPGNTEEYKSHHWGFKDPLLYWLFISFILPVSSPTRTQPSCSCLCFLFFTFHRHFEPEEEVQSHPSTSHISGAALLCFLCHRVVL